MGLLLRAASLASFLFSNSKGFKVSAMDIPRPDNLIPDENEPLETPSASPSLDGSHIESTDWTIATLLSKENLFHALLAVYVRYETDGLEPGAERWIFDDIKHGPALLDEVRAYWCSLVKGRYRKEVNVDASLFPYSLTFIRRSWLSVRKMTTPKKMKYIRMFGITPPPKFDSEAA